MARKRYQRILEAAQYYAAIDNYIKYITDASKRKTKVGSGQNRPVSKALYIIPFGKTLATGQMVKVSAAEPTWNAISGQSQISTRVDDTAPTDADNILKLGGFTPARCTVVTGRGQGKVETSAVTGLKYLSYGGKSSSFPFGRADGDDTYSAATTGITTGLRATATYAAAAISFKEENFTA